MCIWFTQIARESQVINDADDFVIIPFLTCTTYASSDRTFFWKNVCAKVSLMMTTFG